MMIWSILFICLLTAPALKAQSDETIMSQIKLREAQLMTEVKEKKWPPQKIYDAYRIVGDEFTYASKPEMAAYFYQEAVAIVGVPDKKGAFLQLAAAYKVAGKTDELKRVLDMGDSHFAKDKASEVERSHWQLFRLSVSDRLFHEMFSPQEQKVFRQSPGLGEALIQHDVKIYFERKKYDQVLALYDRKKLPDLRPDQQIVYDVASYLAGQNKNAPYCRKSYEKFPLAQKGSYALSLCATMLKPEKDKSTLAAELDRIGTIIKSRNPESMYLVHALRAHFKL